MGLCPQASPRDKVDLYTVWSDKKPNPTGCVLISIKMDSHIPLLSFKYYMSTFAVIEAVNMNVQIDIVWIHYAYIRVYPYILYTKPLQVSADFAWWTHLAHLARAMISCLGSNPVLLSLRIDTPSSQPHHLD